ncbi:hypothetical protein P0F65_11400 [Sphingomonas sp. I4]
MAFDPATRRVAAAAVSGTALTGIGALLVLAWQGGMLASIAGLVLCAAWLVVAGCWATLRGLTGDKDGKKRRDLSKGRRFPRCSTRYPCRCCGWTVPPHGRSTEPDGHCLPPTTD